MQVKFKLEVLLSIQQKFGINDMKSKIGVALVSLLLYGVNANAEDGENLIYVASGPAKNGDAQTTSNATPFTVGYLKLSKTSDLVIGFDLSGEGTKLDSTWGQTKAVKQAISINLLIGKNLMRDENSRFDVAIVAGAREKTSSCPASYLGYQCYANSQPNTTYSFNPGLLFAWSNKTMMFGFRATGESSQGLVGFNF